MFVRGLFETWKFFLITAGVELFPMKFLQISNMNVQNVAYKFANLYFTVHNMCVFYYPRTPFELEHSNMKYGFANLL